MISPDALLAAVASQRKYDAPRLVYSDWLEDHGDVNRAEFIRAQCEAARLRPGIPRRLELLRRGDDLLVECEKSWLGEWSSRLIQWEFRRGFVHSVRLTAAQFLRHGNALFRTEPVVRVELVNDDGGALTEEMIREVVACPAFGQVRDCGVVPAEALEPTPVNVWLKALAGAAHVRHLRAFGPAGRFQDDPLQCTVDGAFGIDEGTLEAFCQARHLRTLKALELSHCPIADDDPDHLATSIAGAVFAPRLGKLGLARCRLTERGLARIAAAVTFGRLRRLDLSGNAHDPAVWRELFHSPTLERLNDVTLTADHLPDYAGSRAAIRCRSLTVAGWNDLERDTCGDQEAWLRLIAMGRPPRRLTLFHHNPGEDVFEAMREHRWLRRVGALSISGDSQYDVYAGRTEGLRSLFQPARLPRLAHLNLHEVVDRPLLAALHEWPGLAQLERFSLTDDYFGRWRPDSFTPVQPLWNVRQLGGVRVQTDTDVDAFLRTPGIEGLRQLGLSFVGEDADGKTVQRISRQAVECLLRTDKLQRLESLSIRFDQLPELVDHVVQLFADPKLMPRLRSFSAVGYAQAHEAIEAVRPRFGLRLR